MSSTNQPSKLPGLPVSVRVRKRTSIGMPTNERRSMTARRKLVAPDTLRPEKQRWPEPGVLASNELL